MIPLRFPIVAVDDPTEIAMRRIIADLHVLEKAATASPLIDRCRQIHERLFAIVQMVEAADANVKEHWDDLLGQGVD